MRKKDCLSDAEFIDELRAIIKALEAEVERSSEGWEPSRGIFTSFESSVDPKYK